MSRTVAGKVVSVLAVVALVGLVAFVGKTWWDSRIPGTYSVMSYGSVDTGGGSPVDPHGAHVGSRSVADLRGPTGVPDERFALTAKQADLRLSSGRVVRALTFDGRSPGPELRVREGDLVEVVLRNDDVDDGVTIHWHGVDVPNAEDGVAGVTQDAVLPGERHAYRFRAEQVGTFWYHSHQVSSEAVQRGLFGVLVIEPREKPAEMDLVAVAHTYDGVPTLNRKDSAAREQVPAGRPVRVRLVNTDSVVHRFTVSGTPFRVAAIDGTDLHGPTPIENETLVVAAGGRMDVAFEMPKNGARITLGDSHAALDLATDADQPPAETFDAGPDFDPLSYGTPAATPFSASSTFDRRFELTITKKLGFFDGKPGRHWAIDGHIYPDVPMFAVERGDLVEVTVHNRTDVVHPMHLHGHHALVLSRNGTPSTGSPWWTDTLDVDPGDTYVVAFRADNPGIWMDHCHNLGHAAAGLTMHLAYAGVTTPFEIGASHHNEPE